MAQSDYLRHVLQHGICPRWHKAKSTIDEQYSYGVYAGVMCWDCAIEGFNDQCGYGPEGQGSPNDLIHDGEHYWEEDD